MNPLFVYKSPMIHDYMKIYWDKQYLVEQLKKGNTYLDIAKENRIGITTVQRALKHHGLTRFTPDWTDEEIKVLKKHYGKNINYNKYLPFRSSNAIYHKANRLGLENHKKPRKYYVDEAFFENWSNEMAYILGWFFSDGNVSSDKRTFRLKISFKDKEILEKMNLFLRSDSPIRIIKQHVPSKKYVSTYALLIIHSRKICHDLINLGCVPNKMHKFNIPEMPQAFLKHFIRGYFDGDGSIMFNYPNTIKICFLGSNALFIKKIAETLYNTLGIPINFKKIKKNLWACYYYDDNARQICFWMYEDCGDLFLSRKRNRFIQHIKKRHAHCDIYV